MVSRVRGCILLGLVTVPISSAFAFPPSFLPRASPALRAGAIAARPWQAAGVSMQAGRGRGITVEDVLKNPTFPPEFPFSPKDFTRQDESDDVVFYKQARLVTHIDDKAIEVLTKYYAETIKPGSDILDICSSWISHFPTEFPETMGKRVGLGMNGPELKENKQLSSFDVVNLNKDGKLPYEDNAFDVVTCVVSVDYLNKPLEVFKEVARVLRPGGRFILSQSNRCFQTKAIAVWLQTNDLEHAYIIGSYFHYSGAFKAPFAKDISPKGKVLKILQGGFFPSDPMFIISGEVKK
mmetsp:Transcript_10552/g.23580  ORF Transcript_10552/g.23580 Transcript_10552/m.23580 type:complete len:294 (-) Transcript_10552:285-1166(-)